MIHSVTSKRFKEYYATYVGNVPKISLSARTLQKSARSNSAVAVKTINTREALHGDKKTTGSGVQSLKDQGKQRTQSSK